MSSMIALGGREPRHRSTLARTGEVVDQRRVLLGLVDGLVDDELRRRWERLALETRS